MIHLRFYRDVAWRREDGNLVEGNTVPGDERGVLRLNTIRSASAGSYTCEVRAESGELARRTVRIDVHSKFFHQRQFDCKYYLCLDICGST